MPKACSDRHPQTADAGEMRRHGRLRTSVLSGGKKQSGADGTDAEVHRGMCGVRERTCKEVFSRLPAGIIWHKSLFIMGLESF